MASTSPDPFARPDAGFNDLPGWTWVGTYGGHYLQSDLLANFEHGFFTRRWHGREPAELAGHLSAGVSVHRPQQVHSALVLRASQAAAAPWPEADGLWSDAGGQSLWVCGADCTPVLLADPASGRVAACHAGWRGVAGGILLEAVQALEAAGGRREQLLVALGPAVSLANYQVEPDVSAQLGDRARLKDAGAIADDPEPGRERLDIRRAAVLQLQDLGLEPGQISVCPLCTVAETELFHSWRRDRVRAVQWSGIVSQQAEA